MSAHPTHEDIARLRADVTSQRAELTTLRAAVARGRHRRHRRRSLSLALVALLVALLPLGLLAAGFTDLPSPDQGHNDNINAIAAAGITKGCNPPTNDQYCPFDNVTRQEMASFLARLGGLGSNPPVAHALTAQTAANATHATSADTLGGYAANDLIRVASGTSSGGALNSTKQKIVSLTIDAPAAGFVFVIGQAFTYNFTTNSDTHVQVDWNDEANGKSTFVNEVGGKQASGETLELNASSSGVFPVGGPGPHTYDFEARLAGGPSAGVLNASATVIYIPFGSTGGSTLNLP